MKNLTLRTTFLAVWGAAVILSAAGCGSALAGPASESAAPAESVMAAETLPAETRAPETLPAPEGTAFVTADALNCRTSPEIRPDNIAGSFTYRDEVETYGKEGEWTKVLLGGKICYVKSEYLSADRPAPTTAAETTAASADTGNSTPPAVNNAGAENGQEIGLDSSWKYADFSKINSGKATLWKAASNRKNRTVCVNAGHGTSGGTSVKTLCHPDGTPKVTGGTTSAGATTAVAVSTGMEFADGTAERTVTLKMAKILKDKLLAAGYDVLMIRENEDVQLDNIARTVLANNRADCHIALHWDSSTSDKGAFYMSVPNVSSYRAMEPVASHWQQHHALGDALIAGLKGNGVKIFSDGRLEMDLTQTSYSTVPSVDIELGDKVSDHSEAQLQKLGDGLLAGVNSFFGF